MLVEPTDYASHDVIKPVGLEAQLYVFSTQ